MHHNKLDITNFILQIAITKANCYGGSLTDVVRQDLVGGEGSPLQVGDSAEVKYTGWLFSDHNFGQVRWVALNTLRQRQNGRRFADNIFKCILLNENVWI